MTKVSYLIKIINKMNFKSMFERVESVGKKIKKNKFIIFCDMVWCGLRYGAGYVDYDVIGFYKLNSKQRKTILTRGINNKFVEQLNEREYWHIFDNKNEFNSTFSKYVTRDWLYPVNNNKENVVEWIKKHPVFFAKPNAGQCGKGIEKIKVEDINNQEKIEELYTYLVNNKLELIEEPIKQHEKMNQLNPSSVNTIRMVSVMNKRKKVTILTSFIRIGNGNHVDNFNSGGMTAKVDINTGKILEDAINKEGTIFKKHPISDTKIRNFKIPHFEAAKKMVMEAAKMSEHVRYIGWDVAITVDGPTLVEGNQFPGHDIYQVAEKMTKNKLGVLPEFEKAIEDK